MFCRKCGNELFEGAKFCVACGAETEEKIKNQEHRPTPPIPQTPSVSSKRRKTSLPLLIFGIIFFLVVVAALVWGIMKITTDFFGNSDGQESYITEAEKTKSDAENRKSDTLTENDTSTESETMTFEETEEAFEGYAADIVIAEDDIDASADKSCVLKGIVTYDQGYYLELEERVSIWIDASDRAQKMYQKDQLQIENVILSSDKSQFLLEDQTRIQVEGMKDIHLYVDKAVEITGKINLNGDYSGLRAIIAEIDTLDGSLQDEKEEGVHRYEYIVRDCTWEEARADCLKRNGYLVRINSELEYQYILHEINSKKLDDKIFFLDSRRESAGRDYCWVDENNKLYGESINSYDYWCKDEWLKGEPSYEDQEVDEDCLSMFYFKDEKRWVWNDVPNDILTAVSTYKGKIGYICEFED